MITRLFRWLFDGPCVHKWGVLANERVKGVPVGHLKACPETVQAAIAVSRDSVMVVLACERCGKTKTEVLR